MNRHGFTLIELMLGFGISALMMTLLFQNFSMINKVVRRADDIIEFDFASAIIHNQLERDLSGAFVPPVPPKNPANDTTDAIKDADKKPEDPFAAATKEGRFYSLTFITSNPLRVYPYAKNVTVKPRIVRVEYTLEPQKQKKSDENKEKLYTLIRKESDDLSYKKFKDVRGFEVARNIKTAGLSLMYPKKMEKPDEKPERKKVDKWPLKDDPKEKTPPMPERVEIEISLTDAARRKTQKYAFGFELYGSNAVSLVTTPTVATLLKPDDASKKGADDKAAQKPTGGKTAPVTSPGSAGLAPKVPVAAEKKPLIAGFETLLHKPTQSGAPGVPIAHLDPNFDMNEIEKMIKELQSQNPNFTYNQVNR